MPWKRDLRNEIEIKNQIRSFLNSSFVIVKEITARLLKKSVLCKLNRESVEISASTLFKSLYRSHVRLLGSCSVKRVLL